ncbi:MAG: hypothetical protein GTO18_07620 [Anaerolineales bacterium]|nr:hypothetical protein [Anaerolineales bacterium]
MFELDNDGNLFRFVTDAIENTPPDWRVRITIEILAEDSFREIIDLAGPEKEWNCYTTIEFQRVK